MPTTVSPLAQTAESALSEVTNNLQRIRELAVQSANATNSASDRAALQEEVTQLVAEIDRVANQSNFNGVQVLDGSFTDQIFQVGANVGDTITVSSIVDSTAAGLSLDDGTATSNGVALAGALTAADGLTINGNNVGIVAQDAALIATAITAADATVTATATAAATTAATAGTLASASATTELSVTINGTTITEDAGAGTVTVGDLDAAVTAALGGLGLTATGSLGTNDLVLTDATGGTVDLSEVTLSVAGGATLTGASAAQQAFGTIDLSSSANIVIGGAEAANAGFTAGTVATGENVLSVAAAESLITAVDTALDSVNSSRAVLGAISNRFESVVTSLQTSAESLSAARSRILDADFAAETANLTRAQILQQAGTAILAQANALPQNVLSLLG